MRKRVRKTCAMGVMNEDGMRPLQDWLDQRPLLEVSACVSVVAAMLDALDELHRQGQIQHNLDPSHVIVIGDVHGGAPKIHDLGPRHLPDPREPHGNRGGGDGLIRVPPRYQSPESIRGQPLDARHDLFLVGIVLHQLLTGTYPFEGDHDLARMMAIVSSAPEALKFPPGRDHPSLVAVVRCLLAREPAHRPPSGSRARMELSRAMEEASAPAFRVARATSGVVAIAPAAYIAAGSRGLNQVTTETVAAFMADLFRGGTKETGEAGHVVLPMPVVHPFAMGSEDSPLSLLLDIPDQTLWEIERARKWVVLRAEGRVPVRAGQILTEEKIYTQNLDDYGEDVECGSGIDAIRSLLASLDLQAGHGESEDRAQPRSVKRLALLESYLRNGVSPASLILTTLPVVPRSQRERGTLAFDLDELYRRVIQASTRLSLMHKAGAPVMVERGQREAMLGAIEALFANGRGGRRFMAWSDPVDDDDIESEGRLLFSLADLLRSVPLDVAEVFEGRRVSIESTETVTAVLRGVGLRLDTTSLN